MQSYLTNEITLIKSDSGWWSKLVRLSLQLALQSTQVLPRDNLSEKFVEEHFQVVWKKTEELKRRERRRSLKSFVNTSCVWTWYQLIIRPALQKCSQCSPAGRQKKRMSLQEQVFGTPGLVERLLSVHPPLSIPCLIGPQGSTHSLGIFHQSHLFSPAIAF